MAAAEAELVAAREVQMRVSPSRAPRSLGDLRDIHRHLFQDVYDWAGEFRTTDLRTDGKGARGASIFTPHLLLAREASRIDAVLAETYCLRGMTREGFVAAAADLLVAINRLHPFREGNGRTQRLFLERIASAAGYRLDFTVVTRERMAAVSIAGHDGEGSAVSRLLDEISDPARAAILAKAVRFLRRTGANWNDLHIATTVAGQAYEGRIVARDPGESGDFVLRSDGADVRLLIGFSGDLDDGVEPGDEAELTASRFGPG
ncbi:Fic/DOC family protein [Methylobacterium goesingense]|uniref:protein adenylyltransferase n=1 Tax=Methylobacterium goesingense TaxID=243690 RepID=A0ABV2LBN4_9HYPH|nr:Fic family protein [Methylobacterium goesingense]